MKLKMTAMNIDLSTGYLIEPIGEDGVLPARQIRLTTSAWAPLQGRLMLNPNACALDSFGDPTICTLIAVRVHNVTLSLIEESEGKALFAIKAEGYTGPELRLALLPRRATGGGPLARLLVVQDDGAIARVVNLERPERRAAT